MRNFLLGLTALTVSSFFSPLLAQTANKKASAPAIKTPNTQKEIVNETAPAPSETPAVPASSSENAAQATESETVTAPANRKLQQHGLGIGLGQTFLLGKLADHGDNKITGDILYSYSASYSFDILVNGHFSRHSEGKERVNLMALTSSIKSRAFEFDNFSPYILGGLGFYAPKVRRVLDGTPKWSDRKVVFGMNFGGGVDLRLNDHYVVGVMGQLHWPFNASQSHQPDIKGYYFKLLMTLSYLF